MRLVPASLGKLHALNWGRALSAMSYQRVQLRIVLLSMLLTLPIFPLLLIYMVYTRAGSPSQSVGWVLLGLAAALGIVMAATILWLSWTMLKVSVMRWRGLGFRGAGSAAMVVVTLLVFGLLNVASEIGQSPELLLTGMIPIWIFKWLGLAVILQIVQALLSYWMYLEETPLCTLKSTLQEPYAAQPGPFETTLLFLQQVWIWFGILSVPMYFTVAHIIN